MSRASARAQAGLEASCGKSRDAHWKFLRVRKEASLAKCLTAGDLCLVFIQCFF